MGMCQSEVSPGSVSSQGWCESLASAPQVGHTSVLFSWCWDLAFCEHPGSASSLSQDPVRGLAAWLAKLISGNGFMCSPWVNAHSLPMGSQASKITYWIQQAVGWIWFSTSKMQETSLEWRNIPFACGHFSNQKFVGGNMRQLGFIWCQEICCNPVLLLCEVEEVCRVCSSITSSLQGAGTSVHPARDFPLRLFQAILSCFLWAATTKWE